MSPSTVSLSIIFVIVATGAAIGFLAGVHRKMDLEQWTVGGRGFGTVLMFLLMAGEVYTTFLPAATTPKRSVHSSTRNFAGQALRNRGSGVLITRKLLILGIATTAKKAPLPDPLYVYCTKILLLSVRQTPHSAHSIPWIRRAELGENTQTAGHRPGISSLRLLALP
jgi:hypothetical protein